MTIISNIVGGLGNQMFQYAAGYSLSQRTGQSHKLHLNDYSFINDRKFELENVFELKATFASSSDVKKIIGNKGSLYTRKLLYKLGLSRNILKEKPYVLNKLFFEINGPLYLDGYWQNQKYFQNIKDDLIQDFTLRDSLGDVSKKYLKKIKESNSISMHIRRGDYVHDSHTNSIHGVCSLDYYEDAEKYFNNKISNATYFIFSDDIEWCKNNLNFELPTNFIDHEYAGEKFQSYLQLMTNCKHFIIPNSSFGWWAAWLANFSKKIVVAPKKWFSDSNINTKDLIPDDWIRI